MTDKTETHEEEKMWALIDEYQTAIGIAVSTLCEKIGYGAVMQSASKQWRKKSIDRDGIAANHIVGPCECMTVPCEHPDVDEINIHCEWCCGAGWVTKHVKQIQDEIALKNNSRSNSKISLEDLKKETSQEP